MTRPYILLGSLLFALSPFCGQGAGSAAFAQIDNVVEVEDIYTPTLRDAEPLGVLPDVESTTTPHYNVAYANTSIPTTDYTFQPAPVAQSDVTTKGVPRRYLSLGGGTEGLLSLRGAFGAQLSANDQLDFDLALGGFNGDAARALQKDGDDWRSHFYRTRGILRYEHLFHKATARDYPSASFPYGSSTAYASPSDLHRDDYASSCNANSASLVLQADVENLCFNYSPEDLYTGATSFSTDKQRDLTGGVEARLTPLFVDCSHGSGEHGLAVSGMAAFRFFNQHNPSSLFATDEACEETQFGGGLTLGYRFGATHAAGVSLEAVMTTYGFDAFDDKLTACVQPHYEFTGERLRLHLGANLSFIRGLEDDFSVSPNVEVSYQTGQHSRLFAQATGGIVRNDFRRLNGLTPYWRMTNQIANNPELPDQTTLVDAVVGAEGNLARGLHGRVWGGYEQSENRAELLYDGQLFAADGNRFHADGLLRYDLRDQLHLRLRGTWNHWTSAAPGQCIVNGQLLDLEKEAVAWRPVIDATLTAEGSPVNRLRLGADFTVRTYGSGHELCYERPTTLWLNAGISYQLPVQAVEARGGSLSLYVRGVNLLSRAQDLYPMVNMPGMGIMGGVRVSL